MWIYDSTSGTDIFSNNSWSGKMIIPFMTNGGWSGHVIDNMIKECKSAEAVN